MKRSTNFYPECSEPMLVSLACEGEKEAFEQLVVRRQGQIRGLMRRLSQNETLADDLSQQTFLQAFLKIGDIKDETAFGGWLKRLAINTWLQHCRKKDLLKNTDEPADHHTSTPTPGMGLDLDAALSAIGPSERLCIILSYQEGMSHGEIATTTELPLGTVKSHITRGTAKMKQLLGDYTEGAS